MLLDQRFELLALATHDIFRLDPRKKQFAGACEPGVMRGLVAGGTLRRRERSPIARDGRELPRCERDQDVRDDAVRRRRFEQRLLLRPKLPLPCFERGAVGQRAIPHQSLLRDGALHRLAPIAHPRASHAWKPPVKSARSEPPIA